MDHTPLAAESVGITLVSNGPQETFQLIQHHQCSSAWQEHAGLTLNKKKENMKKTLVGYFAVKNICNHNYNAILMVVENV